MKYANKMCLITTLSFLFLIGCKESTSQVTSTTKTKVTKIKKRPTTPPIKVQRELLILEPGLKPYVIEETNYNDNGDITLVTKYDYYGSGREIGTTTNTYSSQHNLIQSIVNDDGNLTYYAFEYNAQNQKTKESWKRDNGQGNSSQFAYNEHGDLVEEKIFTADGKEDFSRVYEYEYDANGNITVEKKWEKYLDGSENLLMYHLVQDYKEDLLITKIRYNENGKPNRGEEYIYNDNNQVFQVIETSRLGIYKTEYLYNDYGELTDEKISKVSEDGNEALSIHNVTTYDKYGNNLGTFDKIVAKRKPKRVFEYEF